MIGANYIFAASGGSVETEGKQGTLLDMISGSGIRSTHLVNAFET